jgi:hypothetical protein
LSRRYHQWINDSSVLALDLHDLGEQMKFSASEDPTGDKNLGSGCLQVFPRDYQALDDLILFLGKDKSGSVWNARRFT